MKTFLVVCAAVSVFGACTGATVQPIRAVAVLNGDTIHGTVHFTQFACFEPVLVLVNVTGLNVGGHGFHIHETGDLSNGCASLAAHYNPITMNHGGPRDDERHVGDLGNVMGDADGIGWTIFPDHLISLNGPRNIIGRGVIIHQNIDDLGRGPPPDSLITGNAGPRVACGVIGYVNEVQPFECRSLANKISSAVLPFLLVIALLLKV